MEMCDWELLILGIPNENYKRVHTCAWDFVFVSQNCWWFMLFHPWYISQYFPGVDLWQPKLSAIERRKFSFLGKAGNKEAKKTVKIKPTISALTPVHFSYVQRVPLFKNLISFFVVEKLHLPNKVFPPAHVVYYMFFH